MKTGQSSPEENKERKSWTKNCKEKNDNHSMNLIWSNTTKRSQIFRKKKGFDKLNSPLRLSNLRLKEKTLNGKYRIYQIEALIKYTYSFIGKKFGHFS